MQILPHDLDHEFPEYAGLMHEVGSRDDRLTVLFQQYNQVNGEIVDIEENDRPFQDFEFEELKKKRLRIKDEIYRILRNYES
ncbi:MAG TPA: DUF465 domain-containing protein [Burkholderiales bacterium]|nr:DUF465 domain-containing protein [Burkholderiales bacterium]